MDGASDQFTRRALLGRAAAGAAAFAIPALAAEGASASRPGRTVPLPTPAQVRADIQRMVDFGPRYTGTAGHGRFIDWLEVELARAGCVMLPREEVPLTIWEAQRWGLDVLEGDGAGPIAVAGYYPRSQETGEAGVTGPLVYAGALPAPSLSADPASLPSALADYPDAVSTWARGLEGTLGGTLDGAIAVVDVPMPLTLVTGIFLPIATHLNWPGHTEADWLTGDYKRAWIAPGVTGIPTAPFKALGALGCVFVLDASPAAVRGLYAPFENGFEELPALFVDREAGARLRVRAGARPRTRLTLTAARRKGTSPALLGYLPGRSQEALIIDTHTDGEGFVEENGGVALVQLARHFGSLPAEQRLRRTLVFSLWPGHMASGMPQLQGVIDAHPDIVRSAAAAITAEHFGCSEWVDTADRGYHATGEAEVLGVWTTQGPVFDLTRAATVAHALPRTALLRPPVQFGVGGAFQGAGVPQVGFLAGPYYLLNQAPGSDMDKLDEALAARQIAWTADLLRRMDALTAHELATGDPTLGRKTAGPPAHFPPAAPLHLRVALPATTRARVRATGTLRARIELDRPADVTLRAVLEQRHGTGVTRTPLARRTVSTDGAAVTTVVLRVGRSGRHALAAGGRVVLTAQAQHAGRAYARQARRTLR